MSDEEPWRGGRRWEPAMRPRRWPPFVALMVPCGAFAFSLGHRLHALPLAEKAAGLLAVVLACAAPLLATRLADVLAARFDEGIATPPRAYLPRCAALVAGGLSAAFASPALLVLGIGACGYEAACAVQAWRAERASETLR